MQKKYQRGRVGGILRTRDSFYPVTTAKINTPHITYADLSEIVRMHPECVIWLDFFHHLTSDGRLAALLHCRRYCQRRRLSLTGVIRSHGVLEMIWLEGHVDTVTAACVAATYAGIVESNKKHPCTASHGHGYGKHEWSVFTGEY